MNTQPILAFDCATPEASVALRVGEVVDRRSIPSGEQATLLVSTIDQLMREHPVAYAQLGCIVSTIGPGSFTGLRIALATLHGLVLAHATPIKLLSASAAVAWGVTDLSEFTVALNAGKGEMFVQNFTLEDKKPRTTSGITTLKLEAIAELPLPSVGNVAGSTHSVAGPDAAILTQIAQHLPCASLADAQPYYIRPADAKIPTPPSWLQTA